MIALLSISILFLLEAWLEVPVIEMKNGRHPKYQQLNRQEHFRSAVFAGALILLATAYSLQIEANIWALPAILVARRIWFDFPLALLRRRPTKVYEGDDWWQAFFKKIFGANGRLQELALTLAITLLSIYKSIS